MSGATSTCASQRCAALCSVEEFWATSVRSKRPTTAKATTTRRTGGFMIGHVDSRDRLLIRNFRGLFRLHLPAKHTIQRIGGLIHQSLRVVQVGMEILKGQIAAITYLIE